jgi:hypothetical protein
VSAQRDAWAGSFHELLTLQTPRTDAPMHLPDAPPPAAERRRARRLRSMRRLRDGDAAAAAAAGGSAAGAAAAHTDTAEPHPLHCSAAARPSRAAAGGHRDDPSRGGSPRGECAADHSSITQKQRNQIAWFAALTQMAAPPEDTLRSMDKEQAGHWIHSRWAEWLGHQSGAK